MYERLGVRPYINAAGHETRHGGSLMPPEVLAAMQGAAQRHVWLPELQAAAGRRVADVVGAPAALITSGREMPPQEDCADPPARCRWWRGRRDLAHLGQARHNRQSQAFS